MISQAVRENASFTLLKMKAVKLAEKKSETHKQRHIPKPFSLPVYQFELSDARQIQTSTNFTVRTLLTNSRSLTSSYNSPITSLIASCWKCATCRSL